MTITTTSSASVDEAEIEMEVSVHDEMEENQHSEDPETGANAQSPEELANSTYTKFDSKYDLPVDPLQQDRASQIKICSFKRPHMRAFHFAWWSYHVAFLMWFCISPLLSEVQETLSLSKEQIWTSSISAVAGTIVMRFALGPFCDKYGPRIPMGIILLCSAIPTGLTGLVNTSTGLTVIRFFIGIGGSTFVMAQYWMSVMFTKEWVGSANAIVGGWGNLGGGVTQILIGSILFPLFKSIYGGDSEKAWRTVCAFPAMIGIITSICVVKFSDDCPQGNYSKLKKVDQMGHVSVVKVFKEGASDINTWLIFIQYACCFGVEITMNNAAALYFKDEFGLSTESAAAVASIFGWMNLFARGLGGFVSDKSNGRWGMRGRLGWQSFVLFMEGIMVVIFAFSKSLALAITILVFFSVFVQAAEGSSYGIVPYINPPVTGSISGIIGAGGNTGAVGFGLCFRQLTAQAAFVVMGLTILGSSVLSIFVFIKDQPGLIWRTDVPGGSKAEDTELEHEHGTPSHSSGSEADMDDFEENA